YVDRLHARPAGFFITEEEQVSADDRREVCLIDTHVTSSPEYFAGLTVQGIKRFFGSGDQHSHLGRLIEAQLIIEFGGPDWLAGQMATGYQRARKKEKGGILGQFVELTGYARRYAARLLRQHGKKTRVGKTTIIGDVTKKPGRKRQPVYDGEVIEALRKIWMI